MLEWGWPWVLLALPLPWLLAAWRPAPADSAALRLPGLGQRLPDPERLGLRRGRMRVPVPAALVWLLLCTATARPQWLDAPLAPPRSGRDLLLAVDLSGSMAAQDMRLGGVAVDRLTAVKAVLGDFLERRRGDRVGLLLFGVRAYTLVPLTFDLDSVRQQLADSAIGMAGRETAIGDAVALAVKRLRERPASQRVLILLTDGVNTAGELSPERAGELARAESVRVHAIGFGGEGAAVGGLFGLLPAAGAEIDEDTLRGLAGETGGRYFRATNTAELADIYGELDKIEPIEAEVAPVRPRRELYPWPTALAVLVALAAAIGRARPGSRGPPP